MPKYKLVKKGMDNNRPAADTQYGGVFAMYSPFEDTVQVGSPMLPTIPTITQYPTPNILGPKIKLHRTVPVVTVPTITTIPTVNYGCNKPFYANVQCSKNIPAAATPKPCHSLNNSRPCDKDIVDIFLEKFKNKPTIYSPLSDDIPPTLS